MGGGAGGVAEGVRHTLVNRISIEIDCYSSTQYTSFSLSSQATVGYGHTTSLVVSNRLPVTTFQTREQAPVTALPLEYRAVPGLKW